MVRIHGRLRWMPITTRSRQTLPLRLGTEEARKLPLLLFCCQLHLLGPWLTWRMHHLLVALRSDHVMKLTILASTRRVP